MNNMTQYFQNSKIIKAQDGSIINPRLYSSRMYNDYIRQHGTEFGGSNSYVPGFFVYQDTQTGKLKFYKNPYPYRVEHSGTTSKIYDKSGKNVIDVLPYGSIREVTPKQDGHGYTDQYGRYIPALPDLKSKRYWELDPKLIKRGNVKKHQSGGRTQYEIGSLPWFGREVKNLFRAIIEGRKPSDYDPRTQTFRGDGVKLQGGNFGGGGTMKPQEDEYDNNPIDFTNIHIDEESLNPYGKFTFGLPESYDKWYKGKSESQDITQESRYKIAKTIYNQLQAAISKYYPKYSPNQRDNLADYMTRHYVKENGWTVVNYAYGGYGKARNADDWVKGMQKMYPNSMAANNFNAYVEGLKKNINGQMYNSEKPNYYTDLLNSYGGDTVRVGKYLKHIRSIK